MGGLDARDKGYRATELRLRLFSELQSQALFSPRTENLERVCPKNATSPALVHREATLAFGYQYT